MTTTAKPILHPANYVTLAVARNRTGYLDTRIPEQLPTDPAERQQALDDLRLVAEEYSARARQEAALLDTEDTPESVVQNAKTVAAKVNTAVRRWSKEGAPADAGISNEADPVVESLMMAVLTWRLAAHPTAEKEVSIAIDAATFAAGTSLALYRAPAADETNHTGT